MQDVPDTCMISYTSSIYPSFCISPEVTKIFVLETVAAEKEKEGYMELVYEIMHVSGTSCMAYDHEDDTECLCYRCRVVPHILIMHARKVSERRI